MKIINIVLLAILILEIAALILFHIKYIAQFNFRNFMSTLYDKMNLTEEYEYREEYENGKNMNTGKNMNAENMNAGKNMTNMKNMKLFSTNIMIMQH